MSDIEKARIQRDARRTAAGRRTTASTDPEQAILRHLGVEAYKEGHRTDRSKPDKATPED